MDTVKISFDISTSDSDCPFSLEIWLDDLCVLQTGQIADLYKFNHEFADDEKEHELRIVMDGKTIEHTKVDEQGNIIKDATLTISNVVIEDLDVNQLFFEKCVYTHNFNGTQPEIADTFHGVAGCNGTISFKFSTPIYLWLLENM